MDSGQTPFESRKVRERWWPKELRCLVVGESPGGPGSPYFYDQIPVDEDDPVTIRQNFLGALARLKIIASPTLESFRDGGFVFDHAIRAQLPMERIQLERALAAKYESKLASEALHLRPFIEEAQSVWVMGLIARNAVASLYPSIPRQRRKLTPPYQIEQMPKILVSRYLTRMAESEAHEVVRCAVRFI